MNTTEWIAEKIKYKSFKSSFSDSFVVDNDCLFVKEFPDGINAGQLVVTFIPKINGSVCVRLRDLVQQDYYKVDVKQKDNFLIQGESVPVINVKAFQPYTIYLAGTTSIRMHMQLGIFATIEDNSKEYFMIK